MPQKLLQLVSPEVLRCAGQRTFRIRIRHFLHECLTGQAPTAADIQAFINVGGPDLLEDSASLRAWMWSVGRLKKALRAGGNSIPLDAIDHLRLDATYRDRVGELLFWQLLGIFAGQALRAQRSLQFEVTHPPPECLQLDGVGRLAIKAKLAPGSYVVQVKDRACTIISHSSGVLCEIEGTAQVDSRDFKFTPTQRICPEACLAFDNDILCRQFFQPLPLLVGEAGNVQFGEQLRRCWSALETCGIDGISRVLGLCDSLIGLVSLSECVGSASREEALGLAFLPAGTDDTTLAECLLHEALHQMLFRIEESSELFTSESSTAENFYSPWRTDGRPLRMVLHGAFVFSGIASLHIQLKNQPRSTLVGSLETAYRRMEESATALETVRRHGIMNETGKKIAAAVDAEITHARSLLSDTDFLGIREAIRQRANEFPTFIT